MSSPRVVCGDAGFHFPVGGCSFQVLIERVVCWSGNGQDAVEGGLEFGCPGPCFGDAEDLFAGVFDDPCTGVQQPVTHRWPSSSFAMNSAWVVAAAIAIDLLCWTRLLLLRGPLAVAEPQTLESVWDAVPNLS